MFKKKDQNILPGAGEDETLGENKLAQPKYNLLNPSDKTRGTTYSDDGESKLKKYKWFILGGVIVVIISIVLGVTLGGKGGGDGPSPTPIPPLGPWEAWNPYKTTASHDY